MVRALAGRQHDGWCFMVAQRQFPWLTLGVFSSSPSVVRPSPPHGREDGSCNVVRWWAIEPFFLLPQ